jgi:hypothetical protein
MKKIISIFVMLLILSGTFLFQGCLDREPVPYVEYGAFTRPTLVAPDNGAFLTPSGNTVELKWSSTDANSDPQKWDVYFGPSEDPALVATGVTSQTYSVNVNIGTRYYWKVVGWDANNIPTRGEVWSFEIVDPNAALKVKMTWTTDVKEAIGLDVPPEEAANLRLKILDHDQAVVKIVNTSAFEEYAFLASMPDGKYYIVTDLASTINAGDFNAPLNISIDLSFSQKGILSETIPYVNIMTNDFTCDSYYTVLASVTKTGSTYSVESIGKAEWYVDPVSLVGTWDAIDQYEFVDNVEATFTDGKLYIYGLGVDMIENWWGEPVIASNPVPVIFDFTQLGAISIDDQYYFTTTYGGDPYDYNIVGTGKVSLCGATPVITITYDIKYSADGWSIGDYLGELFIATLTPSTGAKGVKTMAPGTTESARKMLPPKPITH